AVVDGEQRPVEQLVDIGTVTAREELQGLLDAFGGLDQAFTGGVLTEVRQQVSNELPHQDSLPQGLRRPGRGRGALRPSGTIAATCLVASLVCPSWAAATPAQGTPIRGAQAAATGAVAADSLYAARDQPGRAREAARL